MTKNYIKSLLNTSSQSNDKPSEKTISFLLSYSKSFKILKSKLMKEIRFEEN